MHIPEGDGDMNCNRCTRSSHQKIDKATGRLGNKRRRGEHPDYSIIKIRQNTEKSPGDLRKLAVTQTQVENHQLTLVSANYGVGASEDTDYSNL